MNTRLKAILAFLCLSLKKVYHWTRCSSLITSDPLCTLPTPGFECPVALSQEAPTALMQTGKKEPRLINHDKPRRMAVMFLLLQLLFPLLTAVAVASGSLDFIGRWYHCWGVCLQTSTLQIRSTTSTLRLRKQISHTAWCLSHGTSRKSWVHTRCNKPAFDPGDFFRCRKAWCCTCTVDSSAQLSMSGPLDSGKVLFLCYFLPKTRSYMLSYVFLKEWSKSTLLRNGSSLKICCDDPLRPYELKLALSGKGKMLVFHSPRCLICSKAAENVWRHWWKLGDAWTFKSGKKSRN